jgi:hypothetical protein
MGGGGASGGGLGAGMGSGVGMTSGGTMVGRMRAGAIAIPGEIVVAAAPPDPLEEAYSRMGGNVDTLKSVIRNSPSVFSRVLGSDGRDWNGMHAFLPTFVGKDRIALEEAIDRHQLPLSKLKFSGTADDNQMRNKAIWLDDFVRRLLAQGPSLEDRPEENLLVQDIDHVIQSVVEDYRPLRLSDYEEGAGVDASA